MTHVYAALCCWELVFEVVLFKEKTAYEVRIGDWSSDVCSSDLGASAPRAGYDDERVAELLRTRGRGPIDHRSGGDRPAIPSPPLSRDGRDHAWLRAQDRKSVV